MYTYTYIHTHTYTHISIHTFLHKEVCHNLAFWDSEISVVPHSTRSQKWCFKKCDSKICCLSSFLKKGYQNFPSKSRDLIPFDCTSANM